MTVSPILSKDDYNIFDVQHLINDKDVTTNLITSM